MSDGPSPETGTPPDEKPFQFSRMLATIADGKPDPRNDPFAR